MRRGDVKEITSQNHSRTQTNLLLSQANYPQMNLRLVVVLLTSFSFTFHHTISFSLSQPTVNTSKRHLVTRKNMNSQGCDMSGHPSTLPGDPSLNLVTNVDLGDKKLEIMKGWLFFLLLNLNTKLCISHQSILCLYFFSLNQLALKLSKLQQESQKHILVSQIECLLFKLKSFYMRSNDTYLVLTYRSQLYLLLTKVREEKPLCYYDSKLTKTLYSTFQRM